MVIQELFSCSRDQLVLWARDRQRDQSPRWLWMRHARLWPDGANVSQSLTEAHKPLGDWRRGTAASCMSLPWKQVTNFNIKPQTELFIKCPKSFRDIFLILIFFFIHFLLVRGGGRGWILRSITAAWGSLERKRVSEAKPPQCAVRKQQRSKWNLTWACVFGLRRGKKTKQETNHHHHHHHHQKNKINSQSEVVSLTCATLFQTN